jgi:hypothetical protein
MGSAENAIKTINISVQGQPSFKVTEAGALLHQSCLGVNYSGAEQNERTMHEQNYTELGVIIATVTSEIVGDL